MTSGWDYENKGLLICKQNFCLPSGEILFVKGRSYRYGLSGRTLPNGKYTVDVVQVEVDPQKTDQRYFFGNGGTPYTSYNVWDYFYTNTEIKKLVRKMKLQKLNQK